jgi:rhodanese-related sulfurtransferase
MTVLVHTAPHATMTTDEVRAALVARAEIALLDVREEDPFAQSHPLWAANLPLSRLELEAWGRIPRRDTRIVVYDDGEGLAERAVERLHALGYTDVKPLAGGLAGWRDSGGELFRDVNVPSKSFGELVESKRHTPSLSAAEVQALLAQNADVVVLDARRFDEYQTMNIPGSTSVPGGELVLRARELAPDPATRVIVNCAGRTRSIIGTQSLVNAGLPNPVAALRNGTIGWTLAGQALEHGAARRFGPEVSAAHREAARIAATDVARRAGVAWVDTTTLAQWLHEAQRTTYRFDVRTPEEYAAGHRAGFRSAPGGQLVQETDVHAPVRGARIVLTDDDGVRAAMAASWLAQMGWQVAVLDAPWPSADALATGADNAPQPVPPEVRSVTPAGLADWLATGDAVVIDLTASANFVKRHVPGAWFAVRSQLAQRLPEWLPRLGAPGRLVLTCGSSLLARFAAKDIEALTTSEVWVLEGGTAAWVAAGLPVESGDARLLSKRIDRYRRPYEGTDNAAAAMQAYLDWEFGLVEQLGRDGTHHFFVV